MSVWKQIAIAIVLIVAAAVGWARFFPGAGEILARWGIEWAAAAPGEASVPGGSGGQQGGGNRAAPEVVTAPVALATINDRLSAIGTGRASSSVVVNPFAAGRLTEVLVASGATVAKGSVIARLDSDTEEIAVDRAVISLDDAKARLDRIKALRTSNTASAVQVTEAELAFRNAELALRDAELTLQRRSIVAPISGIVGIIPVEAGNYVTTQTTIATIDDRSRIIVDFWVPERYASAIAVGAPLSATPIARPTETFEGAVSAVDNRLDEASRTLRVQAAIANPKDALRAGMSFQVLMRFPGDTYPSVSPLAIQWGTDGAFVWAIRDGKARRTPVHIVQRNTESVLVEAAIGNGDFVVTEGVHDVREGGDVMIANNTAPAAGAIGPGSGSGS